MAEGMTQQDVSRQELINSYTSITDHEKFDKDGYLVLKKLCNPKDLFCEPPQQKGQYNYNGSLDRFDHVPVENQVEGSTSRYYYPPYKRMHSKIRVKLEEAIDRKLYNTYYYDRFYNPGQALSVHADRPACEISVTIHIGTNIKEPWPIWIKTPDVYDDPKKKTKIPIIDTHRIAKNQNNRNLIIFENKKLLLDLRDDLLFHYPGFLNGLSPSSI